MTVPDLTGRTLVGRRGHGDRRHLRGARLGRLGGRPHGLGRHDGEDLLELRLRGLAALGLATVSTVSSRVIRAGDPRQVTLYMAATALVIFLAITLPRGEFALPATESAWWGFAGTNIFYAIAMIGFFVGIAMIGPAKTTLFSYIEPIAVIASAYVFLGQALLPLQSVGIVIVVGALIVAGIAGLRQTPRD